jgi:hypothetical protein
MSVLKLAAAAAAAKAAARCGRVAIFNFSSSASWSRFALALRFWNHIFTWRTKKKKNYWTSAKQQHPIK